MKASSAATATALPGRWRWRRWLGVAVVALGFLSVLVPIFFSIIGIRSGLPLGHPTGVGLNPDLEVTLESHDKKASSHEFLYMKNSSHEFYNSTETPNQITAWRDDLHSPSAVEQKLYPASGTKNGAVPGGRANILPAEKTFGDGNKRNCQLRFGSYCLWSEHRVQMKDQLLKRFKDQLFVARAYYPSIFKLKSQVKLSREMKQKIQEYEHAFNEVSTDAELPPYNPNTIKKMDAVIAKAKLCRVNCDNVHKKFAQLVDLTEDEVSFNMRQSAFLFHLGVHTMPKSLHCLYLRLTEEYFKYSTVTAENPHAENFDRLNFQHYVIFSKNTLASSVTINSTVMNAQETENLAFHVVTDGQNYYAMKFWFSKNYYKKAVIDVLNIDDFDRNSSYNSKPWHLSLSEEFHVSIGNIYKPSADLRTEYISVFGHAHFLLPKIFKNLKKVILLDDDVVVQQDLSPLWNLNLEGKVNAAMYFCNLRLDHLKEYLGKNTYKSGSCAWMSGLNILDLEKWREHDLTRMYESLLQEHMQISRETEVSWRVAALHTSYLTFQDLVYPLNESLVLSGLGKEYGLSEDAIAKASVLHFNGNMKPWLELGIRGYKRYWRKFLTQDSRFMDECNVYL